jgi:hypothetical protein
MGKSSLMVRTVKRLQLDGIAVDLAERAGGDENASGHRYSVLSLAVAPPSTVRVWPVIREPAMPKMAPPFIS